MAVDGLTLREGDRRGTGYRILMGKAEDRLADIPTASIHCVVTSPPYYGVRDYGVDGQLGLEATSADYMDRLVGTFEEVRRVLRDDGVLWVNLGDTYSTGGREDIPAKNKLLIPQRFALAMQDAGWFVRSEVIWAKPNAMTESVKDRPSNSHEQIWLLSKNAQYWYDVEADKKPLASKTLTTAGCGTGGANRQDALGKVRSGNMARDVPIRTPDVSGSNLRTVWHDITGGNVKEAHFATFPLKLPLRCIKLSTSDVGCCPHCGAGWRRNVEKIRIPTRPGRDSKINRASSQDDSPYEQQKGMVVGNRDPQRHVTETRTVGWGPSCECPHGRADVKPAKVLDFFAGSGTSLIAGLQLGRDVIGIELNDDYADIAEHRIARERCPSDKPAKREASPAGQRDLWGGVQCR